MEEGLEWLARGYGKGNVKLLHVRRDGPVHSIKEFEVSTQLTLESDKDYLVGDNSDVVATDSQKNTVYILAKRHGITSPEAFALLLTDHFLAQYAQVTNVSISVRAYPWQRQVVDGRAHNHAFIFCPEVEHTCKVAKKRGGTAEVWTGLESMRLLKTTQSSFVNFVQDEFRTLPDQEDRIFSTVVSASWRYTDIANIDFGKTWITVIKVIKNNFSGPADSGISSPSVQHTLYNVIKDVLLQLPEVSEMKMTMPNKHYFNIDMSKFENVIGDKFNNEVFLPVDKPSGVISGSLGRKDLTKAKL
ncbi:uricase-like [Portunus trituberculatus]|uniref:uricase-like n=1 Tax=Portunus trituberculatus TaxID=210409 RepID=UPI001E1D033D|nr:uricase-like [Portunus trituberculatus]XP_045115686.1 uricase-like [Portunus trituberculatus]XP_045115687.1 uricase-like [Portunus trituberculatus]